MQTSNAQQDFRSDDPVWVLLAELSLGDFLSDHDRKEEPMAGYLFQTVQELGMSAEGMENIARTLAGFAREASVRTKQERLEFHGRVRIFCQKKMIDDANAAKPCHAEQRKKENQKFPDSARSTLGGWGYFMIEQAADLPPDSSAIPHNSIDLYLYKEGA